MPGGAAMRGAASAGGPVAAAAALGDRWPRWGTGGSDGSAGGPVAALGNRRLRLLLGADDRMTGQWWAIGGVFGYITSPPLLPPTDKLPVGCMRRFHGYTTHRSENKIQCTSNSWQIHRENRYDRAEKIFFAAICPSTEAKISAGYLLNKKHRTNQIFILCFINYLVSSCFIRSLNFLISSACSVMISSFESSSCLCVSISCFCEWSS